MVLKGQFLERMASVQSDGLALEALFHEGHGGPATPCLVAGPHPALGGSMDSPVCTELAWALSRTGRATLRFNYRGVGASQGQGHRPRPDAADELNDLRAAARLLASSAGQERVHVAGYSFGAWLATWLALDRPRSVERLVLVAPPTRELPFDFGAVAAAGVPVRVVVGTEDAWFNPADVEMLRALPGFQVERLPETDHFFLRNLHAAGKLAAEHLGEGERGMVELAPADDDTPLELDVPPRRG